MSAMLQKNATIQVMTGDSLELRLKAYDPAGIRRVFVKCFPFTISQSNRAKLATGETHVPSEESYSQSVIPVTIQIPENAVLGKWGVQFVEFTSGRGSRTGFYRGQGKFDDIIFEVIARPIDEEEMLDFSGVEIDTHGR